MASPISTGGGGNNFEVKVQAAFLLTLLTETFAPVLPAWPVSQLRFQASKLGFATDDLIVFAQNLNSALESKLLCQMTRTCEISKSSPKFAQVIEAAWKDFNNPNIFDLNHDKIALITGPLSAIDINHSRGLLELARHKPANEFFQEIEKGIENTQKKKKLDVFKSLLQAANKDIPVEKDKLFSFLKAFHILSYDFDVKSGVTVSLLHSLIGKSSTAYPEGLWALLVLEAASFNETGGLATRDTLSPELLDFFRSSVQSNIPVDLEPKVPLEPVVISATDLDPEADLAIATLVGTWNEKNSFDKEVLARLYQRTFLTVTTSLRRLLSLLDSDIKLKNGVWLVKDRPQVLRRLGYLIFDDNLERFADIAISTLKQIDPKFELPISERYLAKVRGKVIENSEQLRKGIAAGLALISNNTMELPNCSLDIRTSVSSRSIRRIFQNASWKLWASLNTVLPTLAEAAPDAFLDCLESALNSTDSPFYELFRQEDDSFSSENLLTGTLWALETLAWEEKYLVQSCFALAKLASMDPGGSSGNRPINSLRNILLPWKPHTLANTEKRKSALIAIKKSFPEVAWDLLILLLPERHQSTLGTAKPRFRPLVGETSEENISTGEYWQRVEFYTNEAIDIARNDLAKLGKLVRRIRRFPSHSRDILIEALSDPTLQAKSTQEKAEFWQTIQKVIEFNERFAADAELQDSLAKLALVAQTFEPKDLVLLNLYYFSNEAIRLPGGRGTYAQAVEELQTLRNSAVQKILQQEGWSEVLRLAQVAELPSSVGATVGFVSGIEVQTTVLPVLVDDANAKLQDFAEGYIQANFKTKGWDWVDSFSFDGWTSLQTAKFFAALPFSNQSWDRVEICLGSSQSEYWKIVPVRPYQANENLKVGILKLLESKRFYEALACVDRWLENADFDPQVAIETLQRQPLDQPGYKPDPMVVSEVIKALQSNPEVSKNVLAGIEWSYLNLLDREYYGTDAQTLQQKLASEPEFFCELIQKSYLSDFVVEEERPELSDEQMEMASHCSNLLRSWKVPPGSSETSEFSTSELNEWLKAVKEKCLETGHLDVAMTHVGHVLPYAPPDPSGLWIHKGAAEVLNDEITEDMRYGFQNEIYNSRGVHEIDPSGAPELLLAKQCREKSEQLEADGYARLATTMRKLADIYEYEAKQIIDRHPPSDTTSDDDET